MDIGYYNLNWNLVCLIEPHFVIKKKVVIHFIFGR